MKIEFTADKKTLEAGLHVISDSVNAFKPGEVSERELNIAIEHLDQPIDRAFPGGEISYLPVGTDAHVAIELEDNVARTLLAMLPKYAKAINTAITAAKIGKQIKEQFIHRCTAICHKARGKILKRYGRDKRYCTIEVKCEDIGLTAIVLVEDDGFGNIRPNAWKTYTRVGNVYDTDAVIHMVVKVQADLMKAGKDNHLNFVTMSEDKAREQFFDELDKANSQYAACTPAELEAESVNGLNDDGKACNKCQSICKATEDKETEQTVNMMAGDKEITVSIKIGCAKCVRDDEDDPDAIEYDD